VDGIRVLRTFDPGAGWPVARFFHPRLTRSVSALMRADAEVYYAKAAGFGPGITHDVARLRGAGFISHCAHDHDCVRAQLRYLSARDRAWYLRAIRGADALLAQTEWQRGKFQSEFGLASEVVPNAVDVPARAVDPGIEGDVVWLGTYKEIKRPDWFIRLAAEFPQRRFVMAGVTPPPPLSRDAWLRARASTGSANLDVRGFLTTAEVSALFAGASLLVHTSMVEGFSNVLLEAWAHGLPTVSCVNPDGLVTREGLGAAVTTYEEMVAATAALLANPQARREAGARARAYASRRHAPDVVLDQLAGVMDRVVAKVRARRAR
jgi:glycosyltransferase involved in cell wall biosynthesis